MRRDDQSQQYLLVSTFLQTPSAGLSDSPRVFRYDTWPPLPLLDQSSIFHYLGSCSTLTARTPISSASAGVAGSNTFPLWVQGWVGWPRPRLQIQRNLPNSTWYLNIDQYWATFFVALMVLRATFKLNRPSNTSYLICSASTVPTSSYNVKARSYLESMRRCQCTCLFEAGEPNWVWRFPP